MVFRLRRFAPLKKLMDAYCTRQVFPGFILGTSFRPLPPRLFLSCFVDDVMGSEVLNGCPVCASDIRTVVLLGSRTHPA